MGGCRANQSAACGPELVGQSSDVDWDMGGAAAMQSMELISAVTGVRGEVVGHASPKWAAGQGGAKNLALSGRRAANAGQALELLLQQGQASKPLTYDVGLSGEEHEVAELSAGGVGDEQTQEEAGGDVEADEPGMRRVEINLTVRHEVQTEAPSSENVTTASVKPARCDETHTTDWAFHASGGAGMSGKMGVGVGVMLGALKNERTGQSEVGIFSGGGLGFGLMTPTASAPEWVSFETHGPVDFEAFQDTMMTVSSAAIALGGGSGFVCKVRIPLLTDAVLDLESGIAGIGADFSVNMGVWKFSNALPEPTCHPEAIELAHRGAEGSAIYVHEVETIHTGVFYFDTGVDTLSDESLASLRTFVDECLAAPQTQLGDAR